MHDSDKKRFVTLLSGIADYYGKTLAEGVINLYWQGLVQYDVEAVEKALWEHTQSPDESGRWMPKIADVRQKLEGRTQDQASVAWAKVDKGVRLVGVGRDVAFDDALIHRVIADMGGWTIFGTKTDDEWPFVAREFENRYRGYRIRGEVPEYPSLLIGIFNAQNNVDKRQGQEPIFIGNPQDARRVYDGGTDKPLLQIGQASDVLSTFKLRLASIK